MLLVNSADPGAHLSLLRHWLPDVLLVLAKVSERTLVLNLQPRTWYASGAAIIRPASGFLKSILRSDFVCFKFLIGTAVAVREYMYTHAMRRSAASVHSCMNNRGFILLKAAGQMLCNIITVAKLYSGLE